MPITTKETVTMKEQSTIRPLVQTSAASTTQVEMTQSEYIQQVLYFLLGTLEVLLAFRFIFKLMGANQSGSFVQFIYRTSNVFIYPFEGIFRRAATQGIETNAVLEPATIVAAVVYAIFIWGVMAFLKVLLNKSQPIVE